MRHPIIAQFGDRALKAALLGVAMPDALGGGRPKFF